MTQIKEETEESFRLLQELDEKMCGKKHQRSFLQ